MLVALEHDTSRRLRPAFAQWVAAVDERRVRWRRACLFRAQALHATLATCLGAWREAVMARRAWRRRLFAFSCRLRHQVAFPGCTWLYMVVIHRMFLAIRVGVAAFCNTLYYSH